MEKLYKTETPGVFIKTTWKDGILTIVERIDASEYKGPPLKLVDKYTLTGEKEIIKEGIADGLSELKVISEDEV